MVDTPILKISKPKREKEKYFVFLAIPLIFLSLTFLLASGVCIDNLKFYLEAGHVGAAIYYRDLANQLTFNSIILMGIAIVLLIIGFIIYYTKKDIY
ncbi:hypothetical protein CEE45_10280 [Candidatus Heimdallarchaeota archaeon B3_Heim]|nr:MAG: hypothetical protein CEE45_10280 [Candidatus Heimdallarchaeota archaeon B3_Heim]